MDNNDFNIVFFKENNNLFNKDFSELYRRVFLYNVKETMKIIRKSNKKLTYKVRQIVLLIIRLKNRLFIKATRLLYRILIVIKSAYTLLSQFNPFKSRH